MFLSVNARISTYILGFMGPYIIPVLQSHLALGLSSRILYCTKDRGKGRSDGTKKKKTT